MGSAVQSVSGQRDVGRYRALRSLLGRLERHSLLTLILSRTAWRRLLGLLLPLWGVARREPPASLGIGLGCKAFAAEDFHLRSSASLAGAALGQKPTWV